MIAITILVIYAALCRHFLGVDWGFIAVVLIIIKIVNDIVRDEYRERQ